MTKKVMTHELPGPLDLAREAWQLLVTRIWSFIALFGINVGLVVLAILTSLIVGGTFFFLAGQQVTVLVGVVIGLLAIALLGIFMYVSLLFQAAYLLVLHDASEKIGIKALLKKSRQFVMPLFLTSLLSGLIIMGGIFLFVIPGIILAILFSQAQFVVLFENKKKLLALHTSREYIRGRFFPFLWRSIAVYLPLSILGILFPQSSDTNDGMNALVQVLSLIAGPFYLAYGYILYQHMAKTAKAPKEVSEKDKKIYLYVPLAGLFVLILGIVVVNVGF